MRDWNSDTIDVDYLMDSGLLFKINQTVMHLFGIGIGVKTDSVGEKSFAFIDSREQPEKLVFNEASFELGESKYQRFREEFGGNQITQRQHKLGCACQSYPWTRTNANSSDRP